MAKKKKKKKLRVGRLVLFLVLILVIVALVGAVLYLTLGKKGSGGSSENPTEATTEARVLGYESGVVTSGDSLQSKVDEMYSKAAEGYAGLEYQNIITSTDGEHFTCYIANSLTNRYDMFVAIYVGDDLTNELYLSGLIPIGSAMDSFTGEKKLSSGTYNGTIVMTQVESDNATMHAQVSYAVTITVQ
jgi:hypothetical protein